MILSSSTLRLSLWSLLALFLGITAHAQQIDREKLNTAEARATKAAKALNDLSAVPPGLGIPKEQIQQAKAIAVFPDSTKVNMLLQKFMKGSGLISLRSGEGWSTPAFYGFAVIDKGWSKTKSGSPDIIVLFMEGGLEAFERDHIPLTSAAVYAHEDGRVWRLEVPDDSSAQSGVGSDNNINKAVFGLKAREVVAGTPPKWETPAAIVEFQKALASFARQ